MTSPDTPSAARPLRVAGLALLGLAAVALVIGLVSVVGGGDDGDGNDAQPPASTSTPTSTPESSAGPSPTSPSPTSRSSSPASGTTTNPPGTSTPPGGDGNGEPGKTVPVRVYNNSTIKGLAARAADDFTSFGWRVADTGNYSGGVIPTTTVYYRPGTTEQAAARALGAEFGMRVKPRFGGIEDFPDGVIVILTNDYRTGGKNDGKNEG